MKKKLIVTALVSGLAIYTFFEYRKSEGEGTYAADERPPFSLRADAVDYLSIERDQDSVELRKKEDGSWIMTKPIEDEVEPASVLSAVLGLTTQRTRIFNAEGEAEAEKDWTKYGLKPPAATFVLGAKKARESLSLSTKNAFDGSFYLRKGDDLLVGDTGFAQVSARSSNSFRSRRLYRDEKPLTRIEVTLDKENYVLKKSEGKWQFDPAPGYAVDADKVEAWVERWLEFKPAEIATEAPSEDDRRGFLLVVPSMKLKFNGDWQLAVGQDRAQDVFLQTNRKTTVFKTTALALAQLRVPAIYFRDGRKAFKFPVERAHSIHLKSGKTYTKSDKGWPDEAVALMQNLGTLEAKEFPSSKKTGIASPQILVKDESGREIFSLAWGDDFKAREAYSGGITLIYARTNLSDELIALPKDKLKALESK